MQLHDVKEWIEGFRSLIEGRRVEVRRDDRGYQAGDELLVREVNRHDAGGTGRVAFFRIVRVLRHLDAGGAIDGMIRTDACVLELEAIGPVPCVAPETTADLRFLVELEARLGSMCGEVRLRFDQLCARKVPLSEALEVYLSEAHAALESARGAARERAGDLATAQLTEGA